MRRPAKISPVNRPTTASIIADRLRQGIMDGTFAPGTQLGEADLAERLDVSRGPVREALQRLIQEGLLRSVPHRGVFVIDLDADDIDDIYLARGAVERSAVRVLLENGTPKVFDRLDRLLERMAKAAKRDNWSVVADLDLKFHEALVESTGSKRLVRMFSTLIVETRMCMGELEQAYPARHAIVDEHRELFEAIRAGDDSALQTIDRHFTNAVRDLRPTE
ncbi:MAG TPA: GntR family transcriptional regulator [Jiangellaceae bacterium]